MDHLLRFGVIGNLACNGKLLQLLAPTRNGFIVAICQKAKPKIWKSLALTKIACAQTKY